MPRGLGKTQRSLKDTLQWAWDNKHRAPTFAMIRQIAAGGRPGDRLNPTYERSVRRSLKSLVDSGDVVIVAGKGGQLDPYRYTTVEAFASSTGETAKDTAHAKQIVKEWVEATASISAKMSRLK